MRRCATALAALSIVAALAGCGSKDSPSAASFTTAGGPSAAGPTARPTSSPATLALAAADVSRVSPALVKYYNVHGYATTLEDVAQTMVKAGLAMDPANAVAAYRLDASGKQFKLCVENDAGSWATYNTATNKIETSGLNGDCPSL